MIRGRRPKPTVLRRNDGNPGKRGYSALEPVPPGGSPGCPDHLGNVAGDKWNRLAAVLHDRIGDHPRITVARCRHGGPDGDNRVSRLGFVGVGGNSSGSQQG